MIYVYATVHVSSDWQVEEHAALGSRVFACFVDINFVYVFI